MFGITFTRALREALPTTARCTARLPPIPVGPSSSRWASSYVHLGDLSDNKGAREDVSDAHGLSSALLARDLTPLRE